MKKKINYTIWKILKIWKINISQLEKFLNTLGVQIVLKK